jgi:hypothetical protein
MPMVKNFSVLITGIPPLESYIVSMTSTIIPLKDQKKPSFRSA